MRRLILYILLLLLCSGAAMGQNGAPVGDKLQGAEEPLWANVQNYGAVGNAAYHHHMGEPEDEWSYRAGHYSKLVTADFYTPYFGEAAPNATYMIVPDSQTPGERQICVSQVRPGAKRYTPAVGDVVVAYEGVDLNASVPAADDSAAFEAAIAAGKGRLYLPEGDYMISQLTAAKIKDIAGPGKIWLKEWKGGTTYYLASGSAGVLNYQNYGWIDEAHFHDEIWRSMHWITCLPAVHGWQDSAEFSGNISPRSEFRFDKTREHLNVWLTAQPAVEEKDFPDQVTVCIADMSVSYSVKHDTEWRSAALGFEDGGLYRMSWDGANDELSESSVKDCGGWVEVTLKKEDLFRPISSEKTRKWGLHCWTKNSDSLSGRQVEYVFCTARAWIKEEVAEGSVMCNIGSDMRTAWENRDVREGYVMEACDGATQLLTREPRRFYAYTVPDSQFDQYAPFPS